MYVAEKSMIPPRPRHPALRKIYLKCLFADWISNPQPSPWQETHLIQTKKPAGLLYWSGAEEGGRTLDLLLGKETHYHCATSARSECRGLG